MINPLVYLRPNLFLQKPEAKAIRDGFGEGLLEAGAKDERVVVVGADVGESVRTEAFAKKYPGRYIEVGVAEQNAMGVAAGLAMEGWVPFVSAYAVFSPGRNWEQVRVSVAYAGANVKIAGHHAGVVTGADGATHQALEDIALMRVLPGMAVVVPADAEEAKRAVVAAAGYKGPVYLRLSRPATPVVTTDKTPFEIGQASVLRIGEKVTIVVCGHLVYDALRAGEEVDGEVINMHTVKPLDIRTLINSVRKTGRVVTVEDHQVIGGLGSAVAEALGEHFPAPLRRIGVRDRFGQSGEPEELIKEYGLGWENIVREVRSMRQESRKNCSN